MSQVRVASTYYNRSVEIISRYGFDTDTVYLEAWIEKWTKVCSGELIYLAVLEALHQGRYKIVSIEQILNLWLRRGAASCHFNEEFESLINRPVSEGLSVKNHVKDQVISEQKDLKLEQPEVSQYSVGQLGDSLDNGSDFYTKLKSLAERTAVA